MEISALDFWKGETYVHINKFLAKNTYMKPVDFITELDHNGRVYKIKDIIRSLKNMMYSYSSYRLKYGVPHNKIFYRGDAINKLTTESYNKETFISLSNSKSQAISYQEDSGVIFSVTIDDDVFVLYTGIEGELLIEPNSFWEYLGVVNGNPRIHVSQYREDNQMYGDFILLNLKKSVKDIVDENNENDKNSEELSYIEIEEVKGDIIKNIELFNIADKDYTIINFEEELNLFGINYNKSDIDLLFEYYLFHRDI